MNILQIIFDRTLSVLLMTFTYLIPLLSSIRAVHHKDLQAYQQWLTYFLLIFLLHPICAVLRIHKLFRLIIVLYLSLPKFQGALFVYQEVIHVLLERYAVERKVDEHIDKFKTSIKARLWNIAKDIGWSTLTQMGELVSFVKDAMGNKEHLNVNYMQAGHDTFKRQMIVNSNDEDDSTFVTTMKRNPSHSVLESWSSFCSQEGPEQSNYNLNDVPIQEKEAYVQDFLAMLREGLYVFAAQRPLTSTTEEKGRMDKSKKFRLRVFFYQDRSNKSTTSSSHKKNDSHNDHSNCKSSNRCFVFQSVEHINSHQSQDEMEVILMDDIHEIRRTSANGIEFLSYPSHLVPPSSLDKKCGHLQSEPSLIRTVTTTSEESVSTSSTTTTTINTDVNTLANDIGTNSVPTREVLAEIVLSSHDDRETLFLGLNACLSWFQRDDEQGQQDHHVHGDGKEVIQEIRASDSLQDAWMEENDNDDTNHDDSDDDVNDDMEGEQQHQSSVDLLEEIKDVGDDLNHEEDSNNDENDDNGQKVNNTLEKVHCNLEPENDISSLSNNDDEKNNNNNNNNESKDRLK
jgi:hypothetical protein